MICTTNVSKDSEFDSDILETLARQQETLFIQEK